MLKKMGTEGDYRYRSWTIRSKNKNKEKKVYIYNEFRSTVADFLKLFRNLLLLVVISDELAYYNQFSTSIKSYLNWI